MKGICLINYPKEMPRSHAEEQAEQIRKFFPDWAPILFFYEGQTVHAEFISCCDDLEALNIPASPPVARVPPKAKRAYQRRKTNVNQ